MDFFVVLAASVKPDGKPTGAMCRRTEGALDSSREFEHPVFLLTGSKEEVEAMRDILESKGVGPQSIIDEPASHDTLSSILHCSEILRRRFPKATVHVYSDRYHIPRSRWLFYLCGIKTVPGILPSGLKANGWVQWSFYYLREAAAVLLDTILLLVHPRHARII